MSGGIELAGDIATGALLGRAVEPEAGERSGDRARGVCLNCGTALIGEFCHACGQNGHVHKTLMSIGHDLLHGVFHFEGKVWRTLPMLVAHPGKLTRRYIDGERARFVSPLALFLFFVFLMFASISSLGGGSGVNFDETPRSREQRIASLDGQIAKTQAELTKAQAVAAKGGPDADDAGGEVVGLKATLQGLKVARSTVATSKDGHTRVTLSDARTGWARLDHGIAKANANPELALYKLQSSAYKYSWALIPISVPFVALLFLWRRKFKLYDHAIFVTYSLSFMMLLITVVSLLALIGAPGWLYGCMIAFAPPVHIFAQLRGAYGLRWFSALWRTIVLGIFASITLSLFAMLLLGLGLME
ncbi:DUF3667 domain-containing protein [Sphingomonas sp.]|jgi:hypothetical protein|uniref:DUF3667 domain-containing protein n=1 Tax=Sphingomonas sp. TaxID=28214 RepID=UPI002E34F99F|nr:DUF3667 domain-containing protein [Sphingomonas sp.]HEX4694272.1 DUF3667 domain-containing protein [Sphingomonas sp.]